MSGIVNAKVTRRGFLAGSTSLLAAPAIAQTGDDVEYRGSISNKVRRNASSFRALEWRPYFDNLRRGAILVDISSGIDDDCFVGSLAANHVRSVGQCFVVEIRE